MEYHIFQKTDIITGTKKVTFKDKKSAKIAKQKLKH
jgi:hypothetical protein